MNEAYVPARGITLKKVIVGLVATLLLATLGVFLYFSLVCPCERTPGAYLFGDTVDEPVADWTFANAVPLCQLQVWAGIRPHSINLNCMATPAGELFLSCSACDTKYWASKVGQDESGRLRLNGTVYPIVLNRITDAAVMDSAWAARIAKLQEQGGAGNPAPAADTPRAERWWTFQVTSAT